MSYSIRLEMNAGGPSRMCVELGDLTWNVAPILRKAFDSDDGIHILHGLEAHNAQWRLELAIERILDSPREYARLNPTNGWGSAVETAYMLIKLYYSCINYPAAVVRIM